MIRFYNGKLALLHFAIIVYIVVLVVGLVKNTGFKRFITIEKKEQHGIVIINNVKHPTSYRLERANISYIVTGPIEYLLLPGGANQESVISAILQLGIFVLLFILMWQFNFEDPFQKSYFIKAFLIYQLFVLYIIIEFITGLYLASWHSGFLYHSGYHLYGDPGIRPRHWLLLIVFTVLMNLYYQAIKNRQELDLTI